MRSNTCPKCHGAMAEGFILTERNGRRTVAAWREGPPRRNFLVGLWLTGKPIEIATWRCQRCGFLENYARD